MNLNDTPEEAAFRAEARRWIDANAPRALEAELQRAGPGPLRLADADAFCAAKDWQSRKAAGGWAVPHWPEAYGGRGATPIERVIWQQEEEPYGKLSGLFSVGHGICGPTIMAYADEATKHALLPPLAAGREIWCQLFSEPSAGSDLAGVRTRAVRDGNDWVVDGQKIWTSGAQHADWGLLLARTDPAAAKHKGLTMFFVSMRAPGVDVRPIHQMNGGYEFNEVFLDGVRIADDRRLGAVNDGWQVALAALMNERLAIGARLATGFPEVLALCSGLGTADGPALDDPAVRSRLAAWAVKASGLRFTVLRAMTSLSRGEVPGPENSICKLVAANMKQDIAKFALDLEGEAGALDEPGEAGGGALFQRMLMRAPGRRIAGGTDEILRNIIAERVIGLPGDIRLDKGLPFNQGPS